MIYAVTKMTMLGDELVGLFSDVEEADSYIEGVSLSNEDEQRYAVRGWVVNCPELNSDDDEDEDYDD
jgi:hypothetical protein